MHFIDFPYLQQQQVLRDSLNRLKEKIVQGGFGFITLYVPLIEAPCDQPEEKGSTCHPIKRGGQNQLTQHV